MLSPLHDITFVVLASVKQSILNLCDDTESNDLELKEHTIKTREIITLTCAAKRRKLLNSDDSVQHQISLRINYHYRTKMPP